MRAATASTLGAMTTALARRTVFAAGRPAPHGPKLPGVRKSALSTDDAPTPWEDVTSYNNFYEFAGSDNKDLPSELAPANLVTEPWNVVVEGACQRTGTYPLEDVLDEQTLEERIYRHRCVEDGRWSFRGSGFRWLTSSRAVSRPRTPGTSAFDSHYDRTRMPGAAACRSTGPTPKDYGWTRRCIR